MKNIILTPALVAILGFALAGAPFTAQAQTPTDATPAAAPAKAKKTNKINYAGSLTAVDTTANTATVETTSKKEGTKSLVLSIGGTTKVTRDKKPATLADFKVGEKVTGSYVAEASGTLTAATLNFNTGKAPAKTPKKEKTPKASTAPTPTPAAQ